MIETVVASFGSAAEADRATRRLRARGFADRDINVVTSNVRQGDAETELRDVGEGTGPVAKGAVTGGVLAGAAILAASLAGLAIPGIGPILSAGPLVGTLAAAGAGAAAGSMIGKLADRDDDADAAESPVPSGGTLLTLRTDRARVAEALAVLENAGAIDVALRPEDWRATGSISRTPARRRAARLPRAEYRGI